MPQRSAGLLLFRRPHNRLEVLLVHPGGPYWTRKDAGAWTIPKGQFEEGEDALACARREFEEETGIRLEQPATELGAVRQAGGKLVVGFAVEADLDAAAIRSNTFDIEWPPHSGRKQSFAEVDRAEWFAPEQAMAKINPAQRDFIDRLKALIAT